MNGMRWGVVVGREEIFNFIPDCLSGGARATLRT